MISALKQQRFNQSQIAKALGRHRSSISRLDQNPKGQQATNPVCSFFLVIAAGAMDFPRYPGHTPGT